MRLKGEWGCELGSRPAAPVWLDGRVRMVFTLGIPNLKELLALTEVWP